MEPELAPAVDDAPPWSETITAYDRAHMVTYLRLLDAAREGVDWAQAARLVLRRDPAIAATRACWEAHMQRAEWMTTTGYKALLDQARD